MFTYYFSVISCFFGYLSDVHSSYMENFLLLAIPANVAKSASKVDSIRTAECIKTQKQERKLIKKHNHRLDKILTKLAEK